MEDAVLQRSCTFDVVTRLPENATTCTSVGVGATAVRVGVAVGTGVLVERGVLVRVGVLVGTGVFVERGVLVRVGVPVGIGVAVRVGVGTKNVPVGVGVGVPCSGASTDEPWRAGVAQDEEGRAGAAELFCGFVLAVMDVPASDESTTAPTTAATSTAIPTSLLIAHLEYRGSCSPVQATRPLFARRSGSGSVVDVLEHEIPAQTDDHDSARGQSVAPDVGAHIR